MICLSLLVIISMPVQADRYLDTFDSGDYSGNDGDRPWSGNWQELNEFNGPLDPFVQIIDSPWSIDGPSLLIGMENGSPFSTNTVGCSRELNLSGFDLARFSLSYRCRSAYGEIRIYISRNGGFNWNYITAINPDGAGTQIVTESYDISAYIAPNTVIAFYGDLDTFPQAPDGGVYIDDVLIEAYHGYEISDLALDVEIDQVRPVEGEDVTAVFDLTCTNAVGAVVIDVSIANDLNPVTARPSHGTFDGSVWRIESMSAGQSCELELVVAPESGSAGAEIALKAQIIALDGYDPDNSNDSVIGDIRVLDSGFEIARGVYQEDWSTHVISGLGFTPDLVIIKCDGEKPAVVSTISMPSARSKVLSLSDPLAEEIITSLDNDGFTVRSTGDVADLGLEFTWIAFRAAANVMRVGHYLGDGSDGRFIEGLGFSPDYLMIIPRETGLSCQRFSLQSGDVSLPFNGDGPLGNHIRTMTTDGFEIGNDPAVNGMGQGYDYVVWNAQPATMSVGAYRGNDQDNVDIHEINYMPDYAIIRGEQSFWGGHRSQPPEDGDVSMVYGGSAHRENLIQTLDDRGFQIGSNGRVNRDGVDFYWATFASAPSHADLHLNLIVDEFMPAEEQEITFTLTLGNHGPDATAGVEVELRIPAGLTYRSAIPERGGYDSITGIWNPGAMAAGESIILTLVAEVDEGAAGQLIGIDAEITSSSLKDFDPENDIQHLDLVVRSEGAYTLETAQDTWLIEDHPTENNGADDKLQCRLKTDRTRLTLLQFDLSPIPAELRVDEALMQLYVLHRDTSGDPVQIFRVTDDWEESSATWDSAAEGYDAGELWGSFEPDVNGLISIDVTSLVGEWVAGTQLNQGLMLRATSNNEVSTYGSREISQESRRPRLHVSTNGLADLDLSVTVDDRTPDEEQLVTFTISATNNGPNIATNILISDQLPAGLTWQSGDATHGAYNNGSGLWDLDVLAVGGEAVLTLTALVDAGQGGATLTNLAAVSSLDQHDSVADNNAADVNLTVQLADLLVALTVDESSPTVAAQIAYTVTVANNGPDDASGITVTDRLPTGLSFVSATMSQGAYDDGSGIWDVGSLAAGAELDLVLTAAVGAEVAGAEVVNTAAITTSAQADNVADNNSATTVIDVLSADLAVAVIVDNPLPEAGDIINYSITVINNGPDPAAGVALFDSLPDGLIWNSDAVTHGAYDHVGGEWLLGDLNSGAVATLTLEVEVALAAAGSIVDHTAAITASTPYDTDVDNNSDVASITVPGADLDLTKTVDDGAPDEGNDITYTIAVTNLGPDPTTGITITDLLPGGLTFQSATPTNGTYDDGTGLWTLGALAAGAADTLTLVAMVDFGTGGLVITNSAAITFSDVADSLTTNNSATADIGIGAVDADLALTKTVNMDEPTVGETVIFLITLENNGPDAATHIAVKDLLPPELEFIAAGPSTGAYDPDNGIWSVNSLSPAGSAVLQISARPLPGTTGTAILNEAAITAVDQSDPDAGNNADSAGILVRGADLGFVAELAHPEPAVGDTVLVTYSLTSGGPDPVTGVTATTTFAEGLTLLAAVAGKGDYDDETGLWTVDELDPTESTDLVLEIEIDAGQASRDLLCTIEIASASLADPVSANNSAAVLIEVADPPAADIEIRKGVDDATPATGQEILYTVRALNHGPDPVDGIVVRDLLPLGVTLVSASPSRGTYDSETGLWGCGSLAVDDVAVLELAVTVDEFLAENALVTNRAELHASSLPDPAADNNVDEIDFVVTTAEAIFVAAVQSGGPLWPGLNSRDKVFTLTFVNNTGLPDTLQGFTIHNLSSGAGTREQLDASWTELLLESPPSINDVSDTDRASANFEDGVFTFGELNVPLPAGALVEVDIFSGASILARDGDVLDMGLIEAADLVLARGSPLEIDWPISPPEQHIVDGLTSHQIAIKPLGSRNLMTNSTHNLVLNAVLPGNGYESDVLNKINLYNWGGANFDDIARMDLWVDDGDDIPEIDGDDYFLTRLYFTGSRWERSGLDFPIPSAGQRVYVTVDITEMATEGLTINLGFPGDESDTAIGMAGGNDGPINADRISPDLHVISAENRVALSANLLNNRLVQPGVQRTLIMQLQASNSYDEQRVLRGLTLTNVSSGAGDPADLGESIARLRLWEDCANIGAFDDAATDTLIATAYFAPDGIAATFGSFNWDLPPDGQQHNLFVTADISRDMSADGDLLGVELAAIGDLVFSSQTVVAAAWPLDSGRRLIVDGMVAAQIVNYGAPVITLGPGEGPVLALDIGVPANGYSQDWLQHLTVINIGDAAPVAIDELHLWRDDGNGVFDCGAPDIDLFALTESGGEWQSRLFSSLVDVGGARLFVSLTAAPTLDTSATVRLMVPLNGITMESGNSGPVDDTIENAECQLLSSAPLLATLTCEPGSSTIGQAVSVSMIVRNIGDEPINSITPDALTAVGTGVLTPISGPSPANITLQPAACDTLLWEYEATTTGELTLGGGASGIGDISGLARLALPTATNTHSIFIQAENLDLIYSESMPFSINRGQTNIVPLHLTFSNGAGEEASSVYLQSLRIELRNTAAIGIVPADLLAAVVVKEGAFEYLRKTSFETSGSEIVLDLTSYVPISNQEPVTLALQLDVLPETIVPDFQVRIVGEGSFECFDVTSGAPVEVMLGDGTFPIATDFAHVGAQPTQLDFSLAEEPDLRVSRGQDNVPMLTLDFSNSGIDDITSAIRVTRFAVGLVDSLGATLPGIGEWLAHIRLDGVGGNYLDIPVAADSDSIIVLDLASQLIVPVNEPVRLQLSGDLVDTAAIASMRMTLLSDTLMLARDVITGDSVPVVYAEPAPQGCLITIEEPADLLFAEKLNGFPASLIVGEQDVSALSLRLIHPGTTGDARIRCDGFRVHCRDIHGQLPPGPIIDHVVAVWDGTEQLAISNLSDSESYFDVPLPQVYMEPGDSVVIDLHLDLEAAAPAGSIELFTESDDWLICDGNTEEAVVLTPVPGQDLPVASGMVWLESPARNLQVEMESLMPSVLAADGNELPFAILTLDNIALTGAGDILVDHLVVRASDRAGESRPVGLMATRVSAWLDDVLWAECNDLTADSAIVTLYAAQVLAIAPEEPVELELRVELRAERGELTYESLRLGLEESDIGVVQPINPLLSVQVQGANGQTFPLWTRQGNFTALTLDESYSNFPNPFNAGSEQSCLTYYLDRAAAITLKVWTSRGELVRTLVDGDRRDAGIQQSDFWDGRNGRELVVANGVYIAELQVEYVDGGSERLLRKVAVVR
ncbi:MAG: DUF11 domain-containing protein [bacterium]|nr:DUF11 domain-containing protein [bacterium]